ncbi:MULTISPECIES: DNA gyrase inhibitor YacG [Rhodomicrobium]|uniref:DNA gyrase inhibitor YacG n=1 Tax=Rhodomicrobium TaxID=1068 RepID=UPI000B4AF883|nr:MULTISPECIES: DNA gyrase inhibitor YacG [Rhodomicrobium]
MNHQTGDDKQDNKSEAAAKPTPRCPICGKPREVAYRPFCSKRCADVDLGRWLNERYVVPGDIDADEDGEGAPATSRRSEDESGA